MNSRTFIAFVLLFIGCSGTEQYGSKVQMSSDNDYLAKLAYKLSVPIEEIVLYGHQVANASSADVERLKQIEGIGAKGKFQKYVDAFRQAYFGSEQNYLKAKGTHGHDLVLLGKFLSLQPEANLEGVGILTVVNPGGNQNSVSSSLLINYNTAKQSFRFVVDPLNGLLTPALWMESVGYKFIFEEDYFKANISYGLVELEPASLRKWQQVNKLSSLANILVEARNVSGAFPHDLYTYIKSHYYLTNGIRGTELPEDIPLAWNLERFKVAFIDIYGEADWQQMIDWVTQIYIEGSCL